jgi:hypothetical protein
LSIVDHEWWYGCRTGLDLSPADDDRVYACDGGVFTLTASCQRCVSASITNATGTCQ